MSGGVFLLTITKFNAGIIRLCGLAQFKLMGLWRSCHLTGFIHSSTGPVVHPFASYHEGPRFNPQGGTSVKPRFSLQRSLSTGAVYDSY
jgi:hypothetical protein